MKITIIGAGAIGTTLAALLSKKGTEISIQSNKEIEGDKEIMLMNFRGKTIRKKVRIINTLDDSDWYILAVKSYDVKELINSLKNKKANILCCQNGIKTYNLLKTEINEKRLSHMVTGMGCSKIDTGKAEFKGSGFTFIGEFSGEIRGAINELANIMNESEIECKIVDNIFNYVWLKTIINSSINPVAAYNKVVNGKLSEPSLNDQVKKICNESILIAQKIGIDLPLNPWEEVKNIIRNTSDNKCSMLQDLENGNRTEIDAINGEIIRIAKANNLNCKYNLEFFDKIQSITS
ncbi:MAG: ketopantoate reductase family protein [SAR86 cluster bacterium]|nr:ketopantoate reductase family protein [SAR86 cluster bacterium]